jgi:hypothetical protein
LVLFTLRLYTAGLGKMTTTKREGSQFVWYLFVTVLDVYCCFLLLEHFPFAVFILLIKMENLVSVVETVAFPSHHNFFFLKRKNVKIYYTTFVTTHIPHTCAIFIRRGYTSIFIAFLKHNFTNQIVEGVPF